MQNDEVKTILETHLSDCSVEVSGDGSHFDITVIGTLSLTRH